MKFQQNLQGITLAACGDQLYSTSWSI